MRKGHFDKTDNLNFEPLLMMRTPTMPYSHRRKDLKDILANQTFLASIQNASPDLYNKVVNMGLQPDRLATKVRVSLQKYHNRICHRTTPFGLFAGFTSVGWSDSPIQLTNTSKYVVHSQPDFSKTPLHSTAIEENSFYTNPTLYKTGSSFRYFVAEIPNISNEKKENVKYAVNEVDSVEWLEDLLQFCQCKTSFGKLKDFLLAKELSDESSIINTIQNLLDEQLLLSSSFLSITEDPSLSTSNHFFKKKYNLVDIEKANRINTLENSNLNLEKPLVNGGVPFSRQKDIKDALYIGSFVQEPNTLHDLERFKEAFTEKFGDQCVSLLEALDPENGVGYGNLFQNAQESFLLKGLTLPQPTSLEECPSYRLDTFRRMLLGKWLQQKDNANIEIQEEDLETMSQKKLPLPTGFSVMFRIASDGKLFLQNAGGINPLSLLGRFTAFNDQMADFAHDMARKEFHLNPEVIFADIVHLAGLHTANIEKRKSSRDYELQLVCGSTKEEGQRIPVSDLCVAIKEGQIILWSKHFRKRVIPRLDSAYNHTISDLPVFRMLCDIQYQDVASDFSCSLPAMFPGLGHYPRLSYHNAILSLAEWSIGKTEWEAHVQNSTVENISHWLLEKGLPPFFAVTQGDRQIVLNLESERDVDLLRSLFKSSIPNTIRLREFPFMDSGGSHLVQDIDGNAYLSEFVAFLTNKKSVYQGYPFPTGKAQEPFKRLNGIGDGWVYYKIFVPETRVNEVIKQVIMPFIHLLESKNLMKKWFFVRYKENGKFHIRLRIQADKDHIFSVVKVAEEHFREQEKTLIPMHSSIHLYERELERYGVDMEITESFFCAGSNLVGVFLEKTEISTESPYYYTLALHSTDWITSHLGWSLKRKGDFHHAAYEAFRLELELPYDCYKDMQAKYRQFSQQRDLFGTNTILVCLKENIRLFRREVSKLHFKQENNEEFVGSLIHMHLNRFFVGDPRRQEMMFHFILWRHYESALVRGTTKEFRNACS